MREKNILSYLLLFAILAALVILPARAVIHGDVNDDGEVSIADINCIINNILGNSAPSSSDINEDGEVTIADINAAIDVILNPNPTPPDEGTEAPGLYLGITAFNQQLYTKPISILNHVTRSDFSGFVSSLTTKDASVLYYAVDKSLDALDASPFPKNLRNVVIVTFTDGLDQGSLMLTDQGYLSDMQYASALSSRISDMSVYGCPLQAYTIGLKGTDVTNNEMFMSNLCSLSSSEDNVTLVNNLDEVKARFQTIADNLAKTSYSYSHTLTLTIPGVSNGTHIRFTFDNVNSNIVVNSQKYIEGTFNLASRSLTNVTYHGMTCTSGTTIMPKDVNGVYVTYLFDNLLLDNPSEKIDKNWIQEWYWLADHGKWQKNSEFTAYSVDSVDVESIYTSAIVMLVLDCSSSLSADFVKMKESAITFINTLADYENYNPSDDSQEWVDLGLPSGTLWATRNVGASCPEDYGDYFAWGETEAKENYTWDTYKWCNGEFYELTKYCYDGSYGYNGFIDNKWELDPEDDAAYVNMGPLWRMPSMEQFSELCYCCTWKWTQRNGVFGQLVTGSNGASIFLPAAGHRNCDKLYGKGLVGYYWSRILGDSDEASYMGFEPELLLLNMNRWYGNSVRAVLASQN